MTAKQEPGYLPFKIKALFDYNPDASTPANINLVSGQVYEVTQTDGKGFWWFGRGNGREGWFPASYSDVLMPSQNQPPPLPAQNQTPQQGSAIRSAIQDKITQHQQQQLQQQNMGQFFNNNNNINNSNDGGNFGVQQGNFNNNNNIGRGGFMQNNNINQNNNQNNNQNWGKGGGRGMMGNFDGNNQQNSGGNSLANQLLPGLQRPRFGAVLSLEQKREFIDKGFLIVRDVIPKDILNKALRAINRCISNPQDHSIVPKEISACPELMTSKVLADLLNATPAYEYADQLIGTASHVRGCQIALRYPGSGCTRQFIKKIGLEGILQGFGAASPFIGGVVNQFMGADDEDSYYTFSKDWEKHWHIDGFPDAIKQLKEGEVKNFTMLLGIYLSDANEPNMGNLACYPGSHRQLEQFFQEKGGVIKCLEGGQLGGIKMVSDQMNSSGVLAPMEQICVKAGDIVLAHYQTAHGIAPNVSPNVRYCVYFRLHHASHQIDGPKPECLTNIWCDYEGIRDLAYQMYPPRY